MAVIFEFRSRDFLSGCRHWAALTLLIAAAISSAQAQNVAAIVNGEPITALDVEQRSKLLEASSPTHQAPSRQEVLDALIDEKLAAPEAKRWGVDASDVLKAIDASARSKQLKQELRRNALIEYK
jgi:peptidyl-prolyl cis-trans isomerase SurA